MMSIFLKDPGGVIEHAVDWDAGYLAGRTISQSSWQVEPAGLALSAARLADGRAVITLSGGAAGSVYRVSNRVTLSDDSSDERTLVVRVEER
ncbi:hypothetical protein [Sandarakinorhabdus sp.]|uniref:phage fiber-tail adaptor protein n=1 Tax=Sandarakinorhabdus sp. TaxID=1916663 RepID=UPI00286E80CD|nr:hypothetical protein [Sandarakinorhabdus sp.]